MTYTHGWPPRQQLILTHPQSRLLAGVKFFFFFFRSKVEHIIHKVKMSQTSYRALLQSKFKKVVGGAIAQFGHRDPRPWALAAQSTEKFASRLQCWKRRLGQLWSRAIAFSSKGLQSSDGSRRWFMVSTNSRQTDSRAGVKLLSMVLVIFP